MTTHGPVRWRQREASRAIRAAEQAGLKVSGVEIAPDGTIRVLTGQGNGKQEAAPTLDPIDVAAFVGNIKQGNTLRSFPMRLRGGSGRNRIPL
jgi:hypothetical protein